MFTNTVPFRLARNSQVDITPLVELMKLGSNLKTKTLLFDLEYNNMIGVESSKADPYNIYYIRTFTNPDTLAYIGNMIQYVINANPQIVPFLVYNTLCQDLKNVEKRVAEEGKQFQVMMSQDTGTVTVCGEEKDRNTFMEFVYNPYTVTLVTFNTKLLYPVRIAEYGLAYMGIPLVLQKDLTGTELLERRDNLVADDGSFIADIEGYKLTINKNVIQKKKGDQVILQIYQESPEAAAISVNYLVNRTSKTTFFDMCGNKVRIDTSTKTTVNYRMF